MYCDSSQIKFDLTQHQKRAAGFTLLEVAVVLVVIALVMVGGAQLLSGTQVAVQQTTGQASLQQARAALLEFVRLQRRLPCPDTNGSGREGSCQNGELSGTLPYVSLGLTMPTITTASPAIRYAVLRGVNADLVRPTSLTGPLSDAISQSGTVSDGTLELMAVIRGWVSQTATSSLPFIGDANAGCRQPAFNPAFALSLSSLAKGAKGPLCFTQQDVWVGVPELLDFVNRIAQ
ncbi:prepilin-type N-terminal cleavage/methylation domain-containing protein [Burkholderia seminalis]|uniref:prepilin-type N-terminal cleavage/methylation domain-containing protein n=1 Tax=Burkholderia seminalis TaxID=488731 RepID=UPI001CF2ADDB|nr:prepilin-type N-terminal cleavage/methylation domain-containing protein [Burkholderia seminalis]MCA8435259.1 prepilin-type N-terminal cleavage/methylation domain-containing protein [Burkholderia seminalis]